MLGIDNLYRELQTLKIHCDIYLFGSYLYSDNWADLDVLIIYRYYEDVPTIKKVFSKNLLHTPLDLNFMTNEEEKIYNFINQTNAQKIFPKDTH